VDIGLAVNSEVHGYYTAHNSEHFDEVVRHAGDLLGATDNNIDSWKTLSPYELYVLLVAIRVHDVGNIHGRELHEKQCFPFLRQHQELLGGDPSELKTIARIAEAHGGEQNGSKDTISFLNTIEHVANIKIRSRLLAAIVRFADEICEHSGRAAKYLLKHGKIPKHSEIYHKYALAIKGSIYNSQDRRLHVTFNITTDDIVQTWGCGDRKKDNTHYDTIYLIDEILDRIEKMDRERRYCNMYSRGTYAVESIRATISIVDPITLDEIGEIPVPELMDEGYPDKAVLSLRQKLQEYSGLAMSQKYASCN
jgi:uncharacterized FlaG/YvyC family protein